MTNISLFGWLEAIPLWRNLSYPVKGALLRAIKGGLSVAVGILLAAALQGVLFPQGLNPLVILAVTSILQAADKFLREISAQNEAEATHEDIPISDVPAQALEAYRKNNPVTNVTNVNTDATVVTPSDNPEEAPTVDTDATVAEVEPVETDPVPAEDVPIEDSDVNPTEFDDPVEDKT